LVSPKDVASPRLLRRYLKRGDDVEAEEETGGGDNEKEEDEEQQGEAVG